MDKGEVSLILKVTPEGWGGLPAKVIFWLGKCEFLWDICKREDGRVEKRLSVFSSHEMPDILLRGEMDMA